MKPSIEEAYFHRQANLYLGVGALACVMGAITLALSGGTGGLVGGVFFVVLGVSWRSMPVVAFGSSHVELRYSPLAAKKLVRLSDIQAVRDDGKRLVLVANGRDVAVPIAHLRDDDRQLVRSRLAERPA